MPDAYRSRRYVRDIVLSSWSVHDFTEIDAEITEHEDNGHDDKQELYDTPLLSCCGIFLG